MSNQGFLKIIWISFATVIINDRFSSRRGLVGSVLAY